MIQRLAGVLTGQQCHQVFVDIVIKYYKTQFSFSMIENYFSGYTPPPPPPPPTPCDTCVFPFTFWGVTHTACTTIDGDPKPWCSTMVDEAGVHVSGAGHWMYCGDECPSSDPSPSPSLEADEVD